APSDQSLRRESELAVARAAAERGARRERLAVSGGHLLSAAFRFLGELLPAPSDSSESKAVTTALEATLKQNLADLVEPDDRGRPRLTFALPDATALDGLTNVLARLLVRTQSANGL
ncbi:MAG: helicase, partial [Acidobacteria bacterium]